jgi:hypothetical protein
MVVQQGSQYIVVFRGTDAGNFTPETAIEGVFQAAPAADVDQDDFNADVSLSLGTGLDNSQAQDAINLTKAVIALAGNYGPAPVFPFFDCLCWIYLGRSKQTRP